MNDGRDGNDTLRREHQSNVRRKHSKGAEHRAPAHGKFTDSEHHPLKGKCVNPKGIFVHFACKNHRYLRTLKTPMNRLNTSSPRKPCAPTLSIVTPSFQQASFIEETLQSVLRQRMDGDEYFVMDGGSEDGTVEVLRRYEGELTGWVSEKDMGQGDALNKGFAKCTGDVLGWVNSDDVYLPGALDAVRAAFAADPNLDFVVGWSVWIDEAGTVLRTKCRCVESKAQAQAGMLAAQPTCFFRRSLFEQTGFFDTSLWISLDTDFFYRMLRITRHVRSLQRYLAACRVHPGAKTQQMTPFGKRSNVFKSESDRLDMLYPELRFPSTWWTIRRFLWRLQFNVQGRRREKTDTRRWCGRKLNETFPWDAPEQAI